MKVLGFLSIAPFPSYAGHRGFEYTSITNCLPQESNVFPSMLKNKLALSDVVGANSSPKPMDHGKEIQTSSERGCCFTEYPYVVPDSGSIRVITGHGSHSRQPEMLESTGSSIIAPNIEGSHDSSQFIHFSKSVGVDTRIITSGRAKSEPKTLTSPHVDESWSYGIGRSTSMDALGIPNTVVASSFNNPSVKEDLISNNSFTISVTCDKGSETKATYARDSLNCEDDRKRIEVTRAKSEPRSKDVGSKKLIEVSRAKSESKSMDVAGSKKAVIDKSVSISCTVRNIKVVSMPSQINQSESTLVEPKTMKCMSQSTGLIPKHLTGSIRGKSEPKFTTTSKPESSTTFFAGAMTNRGMIVRSTSLDVLDSTSLAMSSQPNESYCYEDYRQIITQFGIDDINLHNPLRIESDGMLTRDQTPIEEHDVKPIIKLEAIDDDYCWGQSTDGPYVEHLFHIKDEPPDELRLKNCRVALEKLPFHIVESYLQERPWENIVRKKKRRLWERKSSNKKRKLHSKSHENVTIRGVDLNKYPANKYIVQERPWENIARKKKRRLWERKSSNKKRKLHSKSHEKVTIRGVDLNKYPANKYIVKLQLKECRVVLEKLPDHKVICHDFGIQDCCVVLNRLPDYSISSPNSGIQDCSVVLNRLPDYQINTFSRISNCKVVLQKLPEHQIDRFDEEPSSTNSSSGLTRDQGIFCSQCPYKTTSKYLYQKHLTTHIHPKGFGETLCPNCGFFSSNKIENHNCSDTGLRKCKFCRLNLPVEKKARHLVGKHKELLIGSIQSNKKVPFSCYECCFMTGSKAKLKYHVEVHMGLKPMKKILFRNGRKFYICTLHGLKTFKIQNFEKHMASHGGESYINSLRKHGSNHSPTNATRKYICDFCGYKSNSHSCNVTHMLLVHCDYRPFPCLTCGYRAKSLNLLKIHSVIHSWVKPFACFHCGFRTRRKCTLRNHISCLHRTLRLFSCPSCNSQFKMRGSLIKHLKRQGHVDTNLSAAIC